MIPIGGKNVFFSIRMRFASMNWSTERSLGLCERGFAASECLAIPSEAVNMRAGTTTMAMLESWTGAVARVLFSTDTLNADE